MTKWLFGFKAAHIQEWILRSGRLRDIQGASFLLEDLCTERFLAVCRDLGKHHVLTAAAGEGRVLFECGDAAARLHAAWPLIADLLAPGLLMQQALVEVRSSLPAAHEELAQRLRMARNQPHVALPLASPVMARNPRTGLPAVVRDGEELLDREIEARRRVSHAEARQRNRMGASDLDQRFLGQVNEGRRFVRTDREDGPLAEGFVAVVHVDGNGVGQIVRRVVEQAKEAPEAFRKFSSDLRAVTEAAAGKGVAAIVGRVGGTVQEIPARPILLGGDDLTILVQADHAFAFAEAYLTAFERESKARLQQSITACAGIAVVKANYPYYQAHALAESLCKEAKAHGRRRAKGQAGRSALAFHRVTTSLPREMEHILSHELAGPAGVRLTMGAYGVEDVSQGLPRFQDLRELAQAMSELPRTGLRELASLLHEEKAAAQTAWQRWLEVTKAGHQRVKRARERFLKCLERFGALQEGLPAVRTDATEAEAPALATPILDALRLPESKAEVGDFDQAHSAIEEAKA